MACYSFNFRTDTSLGFAPRPPLAAWLDGPTTSLETVGRIGRASVALAAQSVGQQRELLVTLTAQCSTAATRMSTLAALRAATDGVFWLGTPDKPTIFTRCMRRAMLVAPVVDLLAFSYFPLVVTLKLLAVDGVSVEQYARIVSLATTGTSCAIGTATSAPLVTMHGTWSAGTSRTQTYKNAAGFTLGTLTLTAPTGVSLAAGDHLETDHNISTVTLVTAAGVRSNAFGWITAGDFFVLDPSDDVMAASPILAISAGAAEAYYLVAWSV